MGGPLGFVLSSEKKLNNLATKSYVVSMSCKTAAAAAAAAASPLFKTECQKNEKVLINPKSKS